MKNFKPTSTKTKIAIAILSAALMIPALTGCNGTDAAQSSQSPPKESESASAITDPNQIQIEYYKQLISDLEAKLLKEKEENYVEISKYKQTVAELEAKIENLTQKSEDSSTPSVTPEKDPDLNDHLSITPPSINSSQDNKQTRILYSGNTITGFEGNDTSLTLPYKIGGNVITSIGEGAFQNSDIEKVVIANGIEYIDWFAFAGCKSLCEIYVPSSVTTIGYGAFENCSSFLVIRCEKGSYAEAFAASWGILCITE